MGGANELCTDKTGTLTQNKMTVQAFYVNDHVIDGKKYERLMETPTGEIVAQSVLYNSSAYIGEEDPVTKEKKKTPIGNVTECGLIRYLMDSGVACEELISHRTRASFKILDIPFNSSRKRATSVINLGNGKIRVFVKGAPEIVIKSCHHYHSTEGRVVNLEDAKKLQILNTQI